MDPGKRGTPTPAERKANIDTNPDPDGPLDEIRLPPHDPTRGRAIDDPGSRKKKRVGEEADPREEEDDDTGEMASAGQDLGFDATEEREASSVEDVLEDEEDDWIDHDDRTDR